jgi:hypothetical protein
VGAAVPGSNPQPNLDLPLTEPPGNPEGPSCPSPPQKELRPASTQVSRFLQPEAQLCLIPTDTESAKTKTHAPKQARRLPGSKKGMPCLV